MLNADDLVQLDHMFLAVGDVDIEGELPFAQHRTVLYPEGTVLEMPTANNLFDLRVDPAAEAHAQAAFACHQAAALHLVQNAGALFAAELKNAPANAYAWSFLEREHNEGTLEVRVAGEDLYVPVSCRLWSELMYLPSPAIDGFGTRASWTPRPQAASLLADLTGRVLRGEQAFHPAEYCLFTGMGSLMGPAEGTLPLPGWPCLDPEVQKAIRMTPALMEVIRALVQLPISQLELERQGVSHELVRARALDVVRGIFGPDVLSDSAGEAFDDLQDAFEEDGDDV